MKSDLKIVPLTKPRFDEAVEVVLRAELDTREEIKHHLQLITRDLLKYER